MKRPDLTHLFVAATLFMALASTSDLAAQETMMAGSPAEKAARRADDLLKRYDKNGDGRLDDDERADAKEVMMKEQVERQMARASALPGGLEQYRTQVLEMFDRNRDGRLDEEERTAAEKFAMERGDTAGETPELIKRFDRNGNGRVDPDERATMENYLTELRALGAVPMRSELLRRVDRNSNGRVDAEEFAELEKFSRPRIQDSPILLRRHDSNRDGKLDDDEWIAARAAILHWLSTSGPAVLEAEPTRRDNVTSATGGKPGAEEERRRLEAVAKEVAKRRAQREAAKSSIATPE